MPERRRSTRTPIGAVHIEQDVTIEAPPWRVFDALTKDVAAWWGAAYLAPDGPPKRLVLEAELGGRFYEEWMDGGGCLLARVTSLKRPDHLELTGPIGRGGTVHGRTRFDLKPSESAGATVLSMSARVIGEAMDAATYAEGWNELLNIRLKGFVETGKRYSPGESPVPRQEPEAVPKPAPKKPRARAANPRPRRKATAAAKSDPDDAAAAGLAAASSPVPSPGGHGGEPAG